MTLTALARDKRLWLAAFVIAAVVGLRFSGLSDYLTLTTLREHRHELTAFVANHYMVAVIAYIGLYIVVVAFSVPGAVFLTLAGGFLFGAVVGTFLTVISATIGATLVFLFAKLICGHAALEKLGPEAKKLAANIQENAWSYLLVLRLVPLFPFFLVNLVPAFAGVRLRTFVLTTLFGIMPGAAIFTLSGAGLGHVLDQGETFSIRSILTPEIIAALVGLALLLLAAIPLRKRLKRKKQMKNLRPFL